MIELDLHLIKSRRIELKLTQQDMADYLDMGSKANYSRYESGKYAFDANTIPQRTLIPRNLVRVHLIILPPY